MDMLLLADVVTGWPEQERPKSPSTARDFDTCSLLWLLLSCRLVKFSSWALFLLFSGDGTCLQIDGI